MFISTFLAQAATPQPPSTGPGFMLTMACMAAIFYFMLIRPQQKKAKELKAQISALKTGDNVVTTGGIHGIVANVRDGDSTTLSLKIADNVRIEVDKSAIATIDRSGAAAAEKPAALAAK